MTYSFKGKFLNSSPFSWFDVFILDIFVIIPSLPFQKGLICYSWYTMSWLDQTCYMYNIIDKIGEIYLVNWGKYPLSM